MTVRAHFAALTAIVVSLASAFAADVTVLPAPKGAKVWYVEDHTAPIIALVASFPAGSAYDPHGRSGLAAFAASLFGDGAGGLNSSAFAAALADHGIKLSVVPHRDDLCVTMVTLSSGAREAFHLLGLALAKPRFDADSMARARLRLRRDIAEGRQNTESVARRGFFSLYFGPYTYGRPVEGDAQGLDAVTTQDLHEFARAHWVRGGMNVAIAGDVDRAAVAALLRSAFGSLPLQEPEKPSPPLSVGAPGVHLLAMEGQDSTVVFGEPGMLPGDRAYLPGLLANYILGGSETSRLTEELREKRSLTYHITTALVPYRRAGLMLGEVSTTREDVQQALMDLREVMRKFVAEGPTDDELADAKAHMNEKIQLSSASYEGLATQLNELQRRGLPSDYLERRAGSINAVSADDVRQAASRLFDPKMLTVVVAGSLTEEKDASGDQ